MGTMERPQHQEKNQVPIKKQSWRLDTWTEAIKQCMEAEV